MIRVACTVVILALCGLVLGEPTSRPDAANPVRVALEQAKAARVTARATARSELIAAMDAQIKASADAGNLDELKVLTTQKDTFTFTGLAPNTASVKDATAKYALALRKADGQFVAEYEAAIADYTTQARVQEAL